MTAQQRDHLLLQMNEKLNQMATKEELAQMKNQMVTRDEFIMHISKLESEIIKVIQEVSKVSQTVAKIEVEHGDKLEALFEHLKCMIRNF